MKHSPFPLYPTTILLSAALLAACGGGGGDAGTQPPTVSSASVTATMYGQSALVTINGARLDSGLNVSSAGCSGMTRSTAAPNLSTATTAYYTCKVTGVGAQTVTIARSEDNGTLATANFTIAMPQVTMTVNNGLTGPSGISGSMVLTLRPDKAPITVDNFLAYVSSGFFVATTFHRVVPNFVVQGGGFLASGAAKTPTRDPIALETGKGLSNLQWTLAMARTNVANSATSQFFVNLVDNVPLDTGTVDSNGGYAVFGSVTANTALVTAIAAAPPCNLALPTTSCTPATAVLITAAQQTQ